MTQSDIGIVELKACPFCGSDNVHSEQTITDGSVRCDDCCGKMVKADEPTAIAQWNTRTRDPIIMEMVEALEDIADPMHALKREADASGNKLSSAAYQIANDPYFIKSLAKTALAKVRSK